MVASAPDPVVLAPARDRGDGVVRGVVELDGELVTRSELRAAQLRERGGECATYGAVLESSVRERKVTMRPFMWRVGGRLVSGEARPNGEIIVAREIDALNVGVRTVEDVLWTLEHEAAHIAFRIANESITQTDVASARVRDCQ